MFSPGPPLGVISVPWKGALLFARPKPTCSSLVLSSPEAFSRALFTQLEGAPVRWGLAVPLLASSTLVHMASLPMSPPTEGALELHTHHLIPSLRQVVFQGDRLPFQCSASYLGNDTRIRWYHNRAPLEGDEQAGILLAESLIHDCTFITRYRPCCLFSAGGVGWGRPRYPSSAPQMSRAQTCS